MLATPTPNPLPEAPSLPKPPPPPDILAIFPEERQAARSAPTHGTDEVPSSQPHGSTDPPKSFRDSLLDGLANKTPPLVSYEELVEANLAVDSPMADDGADPPQVKVPRVKIPKAIWQRLCVPWKNAVIIKLLGKSINFRILHARLLKEWRTEQEYEVIDVGMGYFIVRFATPEDCSRILTGGPYKFFDHYLAIQPWEPSFHPAREKAPKTAVWVKLHGVPSMCFHEAIVLYLASKLGKPIKVDSITLLGMREKFARVCVEVDLSQKLPSTFDLDLEELPQTMVLVQYEGLHRICFHYGEFGHTEDYCHYKHPGKTISTGNPNAQAMIELTQALKPNMAENNMEPTRNRKPDQPTKVSASLQAILRIMVKPRGVENGNGAKFSQQNRFAIMEDLMDEETDLIGAIKGKEVIEVGNFGNSSGDSLAMDITHSPILEAQLSSPTHQEVSKSTALPPIPPPTPNSCSVKPKSKPSKKKTKTLGPVPKESKTSAPKPYDPLIVSKKQSDSSLVPPSTLPPTGSSSNVSIGQATPTTPSPTQQAATTLQMLPSIQVAPMSLLETPSTPNLSQAGKPSLTLRPDQNLVANHTSQLTRQVLPMVATQDSVATPFAPSQ
ncbi:hypothetical protein SLEP1_g29305 [Rubroshorea leprosula]|uniref:DUF4283 domain-containing protein n=1 Tax=Rubroshorea leprosula TaxID=152421 RepID=A0AAV5K799_9ROSI|nr:hypothetical protein SLEP1_g29305 [Rubroshorea leprosula]